MTHGQTAAGGVEVTEVDSMARLVYEDRPITTFSPALEEATGLPADTTIPYDLFKQIGGDDAGVRRIVTVVLSALTPPLAMPGREEVARLIDPAAWKWFDQDTENGTASEHDTAVSLNTADRILSLFATQSAAVEAAWRINPQTPSVIITPHGRISIDWSVQMPGEGIDYSLAEETAAAIVEAMNTRAPIAPATGTWLPIASAKARHRYMGAFKTFSGGWEIVGPGQVGRDSVFFNSLGRWELVDRVFALPPADLLDLAIRGTDAKGEPSA